MRGICNSAVQQFLRKACDNHCSVVVPGGNTPRNFFQILSSADIDWHKITLVLSDERMVSVNNSASNYGMIYKYLLEKLPANNRPKIIPQMEKFNHGNYEEILQNTNLLMGEIPNLNQAFLGLGADGHIASLFPGRRFNSLKYDFYHYTKKQVESFQRMTLSIDFLRQIPEVTFLVSGKTKHFALKSLINSQSVNQKSPVLQLIENYPGNVNILCDKSSYSGKGYA